MYVQGAYLGGRANQGSTDRVTAYRSSFTVAHHGKFLQAYYGGDLALGNYRMGKWNSGYRGFIFGRRTSPPVNSDILNRYTGGKWSSAIIWPYVKNCRIQPHLH
jgi:hypothetical protein